MADRALFARVAPHLERAHRQERERLAAEAAALAIAEAAAREERRRCREVVQRLEHLVAHREMQLARGGRPSARNNGEYLAWRDRKLKLARADLERAQRRAREIGAI